jgi:microcystin-dependent protein
MDPILGMIQLFGFGFAPRGWAVCDGSLMSIAQNTALFSLLGNQYGGDGKSTFALPDLRGRVPVGNGQGPGLSGNELGQTGGSENVTLQTSQIPAHTHQLLASSDAQSTGTPASNSLGSAGRGSGANIFAPGANNLVPMASNTGAAGGTQSHSNMQPYLVMNWCIAVEGIFPSRN